MNSGLTDPGIQCLLVSGTNLFAATYGFYNNQRDGSEVFRSTDSGDNWEEMDSGITGDDVSSLAAIGANIYAGAGLVFRSTNNGESWNSTAMKGGKLVLSLATNGSNIFAGTYDSGVYRSTDSGASWSEASMGKSYPIVWSLAVKDGTTFAGTSRGVFFSSDNGITWIGEDTGLTNFDVVTLVVNGSNLFAGTASMGVWRRPLSDFGISAVSEPQQPSAVTIRAWPNPFSQSTTIDFTARTAGYASVSIVNMLGTEVARLFTGELAAGEHRFTWNVGALPCAPTDGMYECIIRMNGQVEQAGLILMR